jgi:hypothetical protein
VGPDAVLVIGFTVIVGVEALFLFTVGLQAQ